MVKSSIHIKSGSGGNTLHNARENFSQSVVFLDEENEVLNSSKEALEIYRQELVKRTQAYTNRTNQKLQSKAITHQSAVVNLLQYHTLEDLQPIKKYIEKEFDTKVFQMAIHRDEGKLVSNDDKTELYSGEDFFKNPDNNKLYFDKEYSKEIDLDKYTIEKNYHAHIEFMGLDSTGAGIKRNYFSMRKLSELQDFTAQTLRMERGVNRYAKKEKSKKRFDPATDKAISSNKQKEQRELKLTVKELKKEIETQRRQMAAAGIYSKEDYQALQALKKSLNKSNFQEIYQEFIDLQEALQEQYRINVKDSKIAEREIKELSEINEFKNDILQNQQKELSEARETIFTLKESNYTLKRDLSSYKQNMSDLELKNKELQEISLTLNKYLSDQMTGSEEFISKSLPERVDFFAKSALKAIKSYKDAIKKQEEQLKKQEEQLKEQEEQLKERFSSSLESQELQKLQNENKKLNTKLEKSYEKIKNLETRLEFKSISEHREIDEDEDEDSYPSTSIGM